LESLQRAPRTNLTALVNANIYRYRDDLPTWNVDGDSQSALTSYPARTLRMLEMMLGERFIPNPTESHVELPLSQAMKDKARESQKELEKTLRVEDADIHYIIPSSALEIKEFSPE